MPPAFLARLQRDLPADAAAIVAALAPRARIGARLNPLVAPPAATLEALQARHGDAITALPGLPHAVVLPAALRAALVDDPAVRGGALQLQNPSSQLPVLALSPRPGEEVLDLAAAPGGKTLHIAALMAGTGRLAAVEAVKARFFRLRENLNVGGAAHVHCYLMDGRQVAHKTPARFDRVLLDAPCSSEARFDAADPGSWAHWSAHKEAECVRKQRGLLAAGLAALKPGGTLVYSTCAFSVAENEGVVDEALRLAAGTVEVLPWQPPPEAGVRVRAGCVAHAGRPLLPALALTLRVLPDDLFDGFFVAVLRKRDDAPGDAAAAPAAGRRQVPGLGQASRRDRGKGRSRR
jgi:16S rRNA (cytosine1407-C5)-methyltransferase